jgi:hypothetical protein
VPEGRGKIPLEDIWTDTPTDEDLGQKRVEAMLLHGEVGSSAADRPAVPHPAIGRACHTEKDIGLLRISGHGAEPSSPQEGLKSDVLHPESF